MGRSVDEADRDGSMYWLWSLLTISITLQCVARNWKVWLATKLFGGIGVSCLQTTIPTYLSEVAPIRIRGAMLMCYSLWFSAGEFFAPVALQVILEKEPDRIITEASVKSAILSEGSCCNLNPGLVV